jgi:hypothetical protein
MHLSRVPQERLDMAVIKDYYFKMKNHGELEEMMGTALKKSMVMSLTTPLMR